MFNKLLCALLILVPVFLFSQTGIDSAQNSLKRYSISLQFGIGANLNLQPVNNYSLSAKFHLSKKSAFRIGVGGNYSNRNGTTVIDFVSYDLNHYSYNISFELLFLFYFNPSSKVNVFAGAGPLYNHSFSRDKGPYYDNVLYKADTKSEGAGPKVTLGGEWFFTNKMSLFAEYEAFFTFGKIHSYERHDDLGSGEFNEYTVDQDDNEFQANTARLGISLYF